MATPVFKCIHTHTTRHVSRLKKKMKKKKRKKEHKQKQKQTKQLPVNVKPRLNDEFCSVSYAIPKESALINMD